MARTPKIDPTTRRHSGRVPVGGEWQTAPSDGWRHGDVPEPPDGLMPESVDVWHGWFESWPASFWTTGDIPQLRLLITTYDAVARGKPGRLMLRGMLDSFGLTPDGRRRLRWLPPTGEPEQEPAPKTPTPSPLPPGWSSGAQERMTGPGGPYEGLRITASGHYRVKWGKEHPGKAK